jgi:hypothetical protein
VETCGNTKKHDEVQIVLDRLAAQDRAEQELNSLADDLARLGT